MCAGTNKIQPLYIFALVVRTKPRTLGKNGLHPKRRATKRQQLCFEIKRLHDPGNLDCSTEPWKHGRFEIRLDRRAVRLRLHFPVSVTGQVRHRREDVERVAPLGGETGIRPRWPMQVQAEVFRQVLPPEDVIQQAPVPRPEEDRMVGDIRILTLRPKVPYEQPHRVARPLDSRVRPPAAVGLGNHVSIQPRGIGVGHHDVGAQLFSARQSHTARRPRFHDQGLDIRVEANLPSLFLDQTDQSVDQYAGPSDREVDPPLPLEERDQRVDRRGGKRVSADQQRVKRQDLPEFLVLDERRHEPIHGPIALEADHRRSDPEHVHRRRERDMPQLFEPDAKNPLAHFHERVVAIHVAGREPRDLGSHPLGVAGVVELGAVVEPDAVERIHREQLDLVLQPATAEPPKLPQQEWCCNHGRSGVEHVPVLTEHARSSTRLVEPLQNGYPIAASPEADGSCQAAEAGADHDCMGSHVVLHRCLQFCLPLTIQIGRSEHSTGLGIWPGGHRLPRVTDTR